MTHSAQAGLLAYGLSYFLRLPIPFGGRTVDHQQISYPITAAGPLPFFTGFPIKQMHLYELLIGYVSTVCQ